MPLRYPDVAEAIASTGMVARGGFVPTPDDGVPPLADGRRAATVVVIGNVGGTMWPRFRREQPSRVDDPLDTWTRDRLGPIAARFHADFVHPSDEPFRPFQRWAQRAEDVFPSPIGLLVHPDHGLWHAYRGAFLVAEEVVGLPPVGRRSSPCETCADRPCRSACPVGAFSDDGYDAIGCARHVLSDAEPRCLTAGCAARRACPVGRRHVYGADQMRFHMLAFMGWADEGER